MGASEEKPNWRRLAYVRYANRVLLGFIGQKKEAISIILLISHFVELLLGIRLNHKETKVRHHEKGVYFLGYRI